MTGRERFLAALRCERVDEVPYTVTLDGFNLTADTPPELLNPFDMVALCHWAGGMVHDRLMPGIVGRPQRECQVESGVEDGDWLAEYYTPAGTLRARTRPSGEANTAFLVDHCVQGPADYEALMALFEDQEIQVSQEGIQAVRDRLAYIGEDGIGYNAFSSSPLMDLGRVWVGLVQLVYDLEDHTAVVEATLEVMLRKALEELDALAANTPAQVLVFWDDATTLYFSPEQFARYILPAYRAFAEIAHGHGKTLVLHDCGHMDGFLPFLVDSGIDAIDWVTPPPTGDVDFRKAQTLLGDHIGLMCTPAPAVMRFGTPDAVEAHLYRVLKGLDLHKGFILQVPPPVGTPRANLERVKQVIAELSTGA